MDQEETPSPLDHSQRVQEPPVLVTTTVLFPWHLRMLSEHWDAQRAVAPKHAGNVVWPHTVTTVCRLNLCLLEWETVLALSHLRVEQTYINSWAQKQPENHSKSLQYPELDSISST